MFPDIAQNLWFNGLMVQTNVPRRGAQNLWFNGLTVYWINAFLDTLPLTLNSKLENHDSEQLICFFESLNVGHLFRTMQFVSKQVSRSLPAVYLYSYIHLHE